jgi:hypothetical protein
MRVRLPKKILFFLLPLLLVKSSIAQIKLGNTATRLEKSALLELDGNRQGFLLPRILDTSLINSLNPPDGMLIYFMPATSGKGLYIRKTGFWQRMTTDSTLSANLNSWSLTGNSGLTGTEKLGSISNTDFSLITSNTPRITITSAGITSILGNTVLGGTLSFSSLLAANIADTSYLTINNTTNVITKRNLNSLPFLQNLNGLTAATQTFAITTNAAAIAFSTSGGTIHNLNIPDADASNRGVVNTGTQTFAGAKTFNSTVVVNNTGSAGTSGLAIPKLTNVTAETAGAKSIGVDASGNVVRTSTAPVYYNSAGITTATKVWVGQQNNSVSPGTGTVTFDITTAGFSNTSFNIQATVQKIGAISFVQMPFAIITSVSTTQVILKLAKGVNLALLGNTTVVETDPTVVIYLRVEGN